MFWRGKRGTSWTKNAVIMEKKIVLYAQTLGLNTCWVALTYSKRKVKIRLEKGEKLCLVIAVGYGDNGWCFSQIKIQRTGNAYTDNAARMVSEGDRCGRCWRLRP